MKTLFDDGCRYAVIGNIKYQFDGELLLFQSMGAWRPLMQYTDSLWVSLLRLNKTQEVCDENAV